MKTSTFLKIIILFVVATTSLFAQATDYNMNPPQAPNTNDANNFNSKIIKDNEQYWYSATTSEDGRMVIIEVDKKHPEKKYLLHSNYHNDHSGIMQDSCIVIFQFDQPDAHFRLINDEIHIHNCITGPGRPVIQINDTTFQVFMPQGYYHLCVQFFRRPLYPHHYNVFRDSMQFVSDTTVSVSYTEAKHRIYFCAVNENGDSLASLSSEVRYSLIYASSAWTSSSSTSTENNFINVSAMKEPFLISSQQFQHIKGKPDIIRSVRFKPLRNISADTTLTNDPNDFLMQHLKVVFPTNATNRMIVIWETARTNPYGGYSGSGSGYTIDESQWTGKLCINSEPDENYVHSVSIEAEINDFHLWDEEYIEIPSLRVVGNQIGAFLGKLPSVVEYLSPDGGELVYGAAPIFASGLHLNNYNDQYQIECYNKIYGPLNEERNYDMQNAHITIYDSSGVELVSTTQKEFEPYQTERGKYHTRIVSGDGTLDAWYDLGKDDPNPPVFTSFRIIDSQGKAVNKLKHGEHNVIQFSATDFIIADTVRNERVSKYLKYQTIFKDSTRIWVKACNSTLWQPLTVQEILEDRLFEKITYPGSTERRGLVYFPKGVLYQAALDSLNLDNTALDVRVSVTDKNGNRSEWTLERACIIGEYNPAGVVKSDDILPQKFALYQNYPNPFNPITTFTFEIPKQAKVELSVYNLMGGKIATLFKGNLEAGMHNVPWNASSLGSGVYFIKLVADEYSAVGKCILLK